MREFWISLEKRSLAAESSQTEKFNLLYSQSV